jgi:hypothetical protein
VPEPSFEDSKDVSSVPSSKYLEHKKDVIRMPTPNLPLVREADSRVDR